MQESILTLKYVFVKQKERLNTISKTENQTNDIKQAKNAANIDQVIFLILRICYLTSKCMMVHQDTFKKYTYTLLQMLVEW